jgi:D-serine deaminase-like pyridoxal phosphate-dependent protein
MDRTAGRVNDHCEIVGAVRTFVMIGENVERLDTPALVVDGDVFEANLRRCMDRLSGRVAVRPHLKTAKAPAVARRVVSVGASGICVAKLGEAEVMLDAGIDDVLITTEIVGTLKAERFARLVRDHPGSRVTTVVDSVDGARSLNEAIARAGCGTVPALVDVNVGQNRCGVEPGDAAAHAARLREFDHLRVVGVQGYEGHLQHVRDQDERRRSCHQAMDRLDRVVRELRAGGHSVDVVTTGGTGTAEFCAEHSVVTEVQPGSFMFMDTDYLKTSGVGYAPALAVVATVISRSGAARAIVDAGLKSLSDDSGPARCRLRGWSYHHAGDEHGVLTAEPGAAALEIGDRVALLPSHIDTTVNLHDAIHVQHRGTVEEIWPITARGKVR